MQPERPVARRPRRRTRPWFVALVLTAISLSDGQAASAADHPNILFILADDVGREVLGCYGGVSYATPRIDRLAAEGVRFQHAYAMPMCHPTRLTLLTGQYPFRLGDPAWATFPRSAESNTLAHVFKLAGYATAISGKWQLALLQDDPQHPHRLGFDEYCLFGHHEGPEYYQPRIWQNGELRQDVAERYGPDVYSEFIIDFIRRHKARPFFAFYSMALCHAVTNDLPEPPPVGPNGRYQSYAEMVAAMDERVGRVLDAIEDAGLTERTMVIYMTDNGTPPRSILDAENGEYVYETVGSRLADGRTIAGGKGTLTDWGIRVPLLVRWPGRAPAGIALDCLVDASDLMPTLADLADLDFSVSDEALDGKSFAACLTDGKPGPRHWIYASHEDRWALRDSRWKLYSDGHFFDAEHDPDECGPLDVGRLPEAAAESHARLTRTRDELRPDP
jgi:arylsulfatase A-like enzyme